GCLFCFCLPVVFAALRPPATFFQPFGLIRPRSLLPSATEPALSAKTTDWRCDLRHAKHISHDCQLRHQPRLGKLKFICRAFSPGKVELSQHRQLLSVARHHLAEPAPACKL